MKLCWSFHFTLAIFSVYFLTVFFFDDEVTHWVALDDRKLNMFDDVDFMKDHFVRTDPKVGLTQENVSQAMKYLHSDPLEESIVLEQ